MDNPMDYCIKCGRRYGVTEESCSGCGFDPVNGDEEEQDTAIEKYRNQVDGK